MNAIAISNNDMVYIHWSIPDKIPNCLGFSVIRHDAIGNKGVTLPAMVGFKVESPSNEDASNRFKDTDTWPIQKYSWKDVFAERGGTYWYEIVPMIGTPDHLSRDESLGSRDAAAEPSVADYYRRSRQRRCKNSYLFRTLAQSVDIGKFPVLLA
jgi:hypothetical protein